MFRISQTPEDEEKDGSEQEYGKYTDDNLCNGISPRELSMGGAGGVGSHNDCLLCTLVVIVVVGRWSSSCHYIAIIQAHNGRGTCRMIEMRRLECET